MKKDFCVNDFKSINPLATMSYYSQTKFFIPPVILSTTVHMCTKIPSFIAPMLIPTIRIQ